MAHPYTLMYTVFLSRGDYLLTLHDSYLLDHAHMYAVCMHSN